MKEREEERMDRRKEKRKKKHLSCGRRYRTLKTTETPARGKYRMHCKLAETSFCDLERVPNHLRA